LDRTANKITIRFANEMDFQDLIILAEEFMPEEASEEKRVKMLKQALMNPSYGLLVADLKGEIIGFTDYWLTCDFVHGAKLSYIHNLYVRSKHRRKGVASKLLKEAMRNAQKTRVSEIHVTTRFDNKSAIRLYKKHGLVKEHLELEKEFE